MIAVHVTDAFLDPHYRSGTLWDGINILFGFVAPAFIFFSGVTTSLALERRVRSGRSTSDILLRAFLLLLLGYWLQIPAHSLHAAFNATPAQIQFLFDLNVLGLIAASIILSVGLVSLFRRPMQWRVAALLLGSGIAICTPLIHGAIDSASLPLAIRFWVSPEGSFPLVPFAAYFLIGFGLAGRLSDGARLGARATLPLVLTAAAILAVVPVHVLTSAIDPDLSFWSYGPALFLFRLGGVLLLWIACVAVPDKVGSDEPRWEGLARFGRASLFVYVAHLVLVYGSPVTMGARFWFDGAIDRALGPWPVTGLFLAVSFLSWLAVIGREGLESRFPGAVRRIALAWWICFVLFFLLAPW